VWTGDCNKKCHEKQNSGDSERRKGGDSREICPDKPDSCDSEIKQFGDWGLQQEVS
jgi:hypothetical protein